MFRRRKQIQCERHSIFSSVHAYFHKVHAYSGLDQEALNPVPSMAAPSTTTRRRTASLRPVCSLATRGQTVFRPIFAPESAPKPMRDNLGGRRQEFKAGEEVYGPQ